MNHEVETIAEQFERIFNRYQALRRRPVQIDNNTELYRSELHIIQAIGMHENINVTRLAGLMGITKGAVSQFAAKLIQKDMIVKRTSPFTDNEVILTLTGRGRTVFDTHQAYHRKMFAELESILDRYPPEVPKAITGLLDCYESYLQ